MERDAHRRILLVGGGTGGHFYPLIAIAEAIAKGGEADIYYAGPSRYDADALRKAGIGYIAVPAGKTRRYRSVLNVFDPFLTLIGALVALLRLYILYPDVVVSKGGYTSVPVIIAAAFLRIPIIVHESDSVIGRANRLAIRFARLVIVSYDETIAQVAGKRVEKLGIPVREELLAPVAQNAREALGIPAGRPLVFVTGGSQ
ncbi:MAG TPA: glycosyltransferase, partial [Candidatus Paceibacterota bacterium]|nr:glycosyltransferase [Candidatus Paceibacterota bacterium]